MFEKLSCTLCEGHFQDNDSRGKFYHLVVNENDKKAIGLDKTTTYTCITLFCKFLYFRRTITSVNTRQQLSFSFPELLYSVLEFNSRKNCQHIF